jgi:hypothetical protein
VKIGWINHNLGKGLSIQYHFSGVPHCKNQLCCKAEPTTPVMLDGQSVTQFVIDPAGLNCNTNFQNENNNFQKNVRISAIRN